MTEPPNTPLQPSNGTGWPLLRQGAVPFAAERQTVGRTVMDETEFWLKMMRRVSGELGGMHDDRLRFLWCDGLDPDHVESDSRGVWIVGLATIMGGSDDDYSFRLRIGDPGVALPEGDWSGLLPSEESTAWLHVDRSNRLLELQPLAAIPDDEATAG